MTEEQKQTIVRLRDMGVGYRKIGIALDIPRDKVRNYCKAKGIDGYAKHLIEKKEWKQMEKVCPEVICRQCGNPIEINPDGRRRVYCSDKCRREWGKKHPTLYKHECLFCGKEFESSTREQKFCSRDCYVRNRFWRQEDTEEVVKLLLAGKKVPKIPKWMKELLGE